jgi:hypothetical protein
VPGEGGEGDDRDEEACEHSADDGAEKGDSGVGPVISPFALDRQECGSNTGTEAAVGIDGAAGGSAESGSDANDKECY